MRRRRRRSTRPRDSQRQAVYDWEKRVGCWEFSASKPDLLTHKEIETLVHKLWTGYTGNINVPKVGRSHGRRGRACYKTRSHEVVFPKWARQPGMVAHEVAHAIVAKKSLGCEVRLAAHGPEFVRVYCELLVSFLGFDPMALKSELTKGKRRVKIARTDALPWRQL